MKIVLKQILELSKSEIKALKRQGFIWGLDDDDPKQSILLKRVLSKALGNGMAIVYDSAPFPVADVYDEAACRPDAIDQADPRGSVPVEDDPAPITTHKRPRRSRPDSTQSEAS